MTSKPTGSQPPSATSNVNEQQEDSQVDTQNSEDKKLQEIVRLCVSLGRKRQHDSKLYRTLQQQSRDLPQLGKLAKVHVELDEFVLDDVPPEEPEIGGDINDLLADHARQDRFHDALSAELGKQTPILKEITSKSAPQRVWRWPAKGFQDLEFWDEFVENQKAMVAMGLGTY